MYSNIQPVFKASLIIAILCLPALYTFGQSGWTKGKGEGYTQLTLGYFASDTYVNLLEERMETATFRQIYASLYGEYGITSRITVLADWPVLKLQRFETTETVGGIGDLKLGVRYGLLQGKFPVSVTLMPEFPTGPANQIAQNLENAFDGINLPAGDGEFNVHGIVAVSHSFYALPLYANLYAGYNARTQFDGRAFQDQLRGGLEIGGQLAKRLNGRLHLSVQQSIGEAPQFVSFVRGEGTNFSTVQGGLTWEMTDKWSVDISSQAYLDAPIGLRNVYSGFVGMVGLVYQWKPKTE